MFKLPHIFPPSVMERDEIHLLKTRDIHDHLPVTSTRLYHLCLNMLKLGALSTSADINSYPVGCEFEPATDKNLIFWRYGGQTHYSRIWNPVLLVLRKLVTITLKGKRKKKKKRLLLLRTANHFHHLHGLLYHYYNELVLADNGIIPLADLKFFTSSFSGWDLNLVFAFSWAFIVFDQLMQVLWFAHSRVLCVVRNNCFSRSITTACHVLVIHLPSMSLFLDLCMPPHL